ncbi:MAG: thioredoxin domain-containing protein, partial [Thermacetogeniaceae bacterium]
PVMVAFWAPQVEESIAAIAELEKIADKLGDSVKLVKMDTYRNQRVASRYGIKEIPSLLLFNKGEVAVKIAGSMSEEKILPHLYARIKSK